SGFEIVHRFQGFEQMRAVLWDGVVAALAIADARKVESQDEEAEFRESAGELDVEAGGAGRGGRGRRGRGESGGGRGGEWGRGGGRVRGWARPPASEQPAPNNTASSFSNMSSRSNWSCAVARGLAF